MQGLMKVLVRYNVIHEEIKVHIKLVGSKIDSKHWCGHNKNFFEIYRLKEQGLVAKYYELGKTGNFHDVNSKISEGDWVLLHRSEYIPNNDVCEWQRFSLVKELVYYKSDDEPLMIKVMDYALNKGNHKLIGGMIKTLSELKKIQGQNGSSYEVNNLKGKITGYVKVDSITEGR